MDGDSMDKAMICREYTAETYADAKAIYRLCHVLCVLRFVDKYHLGCVDRSVDNKETWRHLRIWTRR